MKKLDAKGGQMAKEQQSLYGSAKEWLRFLARK